ncbi:MAG: CARDB domain-containing protein [Candidatus Nanoarchaeia archaeon]
MATKLIKCIFLTIAVIVLLNFFSPAHAKIINASIVNASSHQPVNMNYEATTIKAYIDSAAGNPDVTLQVCTDSEDLTGLFGGFVYKVGNWTDFISIAAMSGGGLGQFSAVGGNCFEVNSTLNFLSDYAVYPAYVYGVVSNNSSVDVNDTFILINKSGGWLGGYYLFNDFQRTYNQSTYKINVNVTKIMGYKNTNSETDPTEIWPGGANVSKQYIIMAVCDKNVSSLEGYNCRNGNRTYPGVMNILDTGITPNQSLAQYTYLVVNGIPYQFCIGPDLSVEAVTATPNPAYQSEIVTLNATIKNKNNVNVSSPFNVSFWRDSNFTANVTIYGLGAGQTAYAVYNYNTTGLHSGSYNIIAKVEDSMFGDCNDSNDNATTQLQIMKTYNLTVYINGTLNKVFPRPGRPYNVSIFVEDSDGNTSLPNLTLRITEKNGLNLFVPTQGWNESGNKKGVISYSIAEVQTNNSGASSLALIPMGNKLYSEEYNYLNISDYVGNYSLYIELFNGSQKLQLYDPNSNRLINQVNLVLENHTVLDPTNSEQNSIVVYNHESWVKQVIQLFVQVFGNVQKWIRE